MRQRLSELSSQSKSGSLKTKSKSIQERRSPSSSNSKHKRNSSSSTSSFNRKSSNSESQDSYSYDPDNIYSKGWKFEYETLGSKGELETQIGKVVEVHSNGQREVQWDNGTSELLHTEDIEECNAVPMFRRTLRVGDEIEYRKTNCGIEATSGGPVTVDGTVMEIGESFFNTTTCPNVRTSATGCPTQHYFKLKKSNHRDAPRTGKWTSFKRVNLELGRADHVEQEEERKDRLTKRAKHMITSEGIGELASIGFAATEVANYVHSELKDARRDSQDKTNYSTGINSEQNSKNEGIQTRSKTKTKL